MHGRPRRSAVPDAVRQKDEQAKIANFQALLAEVLQNHRQRNYSKKTLQGSARLLETNPEVYTAWNFRKLAVKHMLDLEPNDDARKVILEEELQVVERALARNFKSYGPWSHRKWVIDFGLSSLEREFKLLEKLLSVDGRNFLGWSYRRFIASYKRATEEEELQYTTKKINENFSNYSAWHYRSALLSKQFAGNVYQEDRWRNILAKEYELVKQAFFTEPDDQSGWFYLMWLLGQTIPPSAWLHAESRCLKDEWSLDASQSSTTEETRANSDSLVMENPIKWPSQSTKTLVPNMLDLVDDKFSGLSMTTANKGLDASSKWQLETLQDLIKTCRELLDLEIDSKWGKLTLARILMAYDTVAIDHKQHMDEIRHLYKGLSSVDPVHVFYYDEQLSLTLIDEITSDSQKLSRYCGDETISESECGGWLRLNQLSLSKFGYFERLAWVRKLDLSKNKLRSLEGLEALQGLVFFDVSCNLLPSVTALSPIHTISTLQALNISYNEIGAHTIDTYRYMCPSLLNHSYEGGVASLRHLEYPHFKDLLLVFGGMQLNQLDMCGNPIANFDGTRRKMKEVLPSLIWLDGERVRGG